MFSLRLPLTLLLAALPALLQAAPTTYTPTMETPVVTSANRHTLWGMTAEEWTRYRELLAGPAAFRHADRSPLTIMTLYSEGEEQRRWAERLVAHEYAENAREIRANRAFHEAAMRLYPPEPPTGQASSALPPLTAARTAERYLLFVAEGCAACDTLLKQAIALTANHRLDVYLVGAEDAQAVSAWAQRKGIPRHLVPSRLTINVDGGTFARLNRLAHEVPALYAVDEQRMAHAIPNDAAESLLGGVSTGRGGS